MIMQAVGVAEDNIFKKRKEDEVKLLFFLNLQLWIIFFWRKLIKCFICRRTSEGETKKKERGWKWGPQKQSQVFSWTVSVNNGCVRLTAGGAAGSILPDHGPVCPSSLGKKGCSRTHPEPSIPGLRHEDEPQRAEQQGTVSKYGELFRKLSKEINENHHLKWRVGSHRFGLFFTQKNAHSKYWETYLEFYMEISNSLCVYLFFFYSCRTQLSLWKPWWGTKAA